jgi:thiol-disulfide isomerase/thioredoxin
VPVKTIILIAVLLLFSVSTPAQSLPRRNKPALHDINGRPFRLSDYKNKVLLLNFWATWCPPCRTEIPDLIRRQREYRDQGLRIVGVTYPPQSLSEVRRFVRRVKTNYRIAIGSREFKALFTASETLPLTVVIDRRGTVREVIEGIMYADEFDQKVKPILRFAPSLPGKNEVRGALTPALSALPSGRLNGRRTAQLFTN